MPPSYELTRQQESHFWYTGFLSGATPPLPVSCLSTLPPPPTPTPLFRSFSRPQHRSKFKHALQAEDRAHRLGQKGCVQVRYLIAPGTIDDAMWPLLGRKLQVVGKALDGHATGSATGAAQP